jgi:two-component system, sensor histidine kinase and response regulator
MQPVAASCRSEALACLKQARDREQPFPLIISDAEILGTEGLTLAEPIRQDPQLAQSPIIVLTAAGLRGDGARSRGIGVAAYLSKPISEPELLDTILRVLGTTLHETRCGPLITRHSLTEAGPSLRILIVEDNPVNRKLTIRLVEKKGHTANFAITGREALVALEKEHFDLVLMDLQMPEMDGFEATVAVRTKERETGAHIPIVALTASAMEGDRKRCLAAGMDGYVTKPIRANELCAEIDRVLAIVKRSET